MFDYWSYRIAAFVSRRLPGRSAYWVGLRVADAYYYFNHQNREAILSNLKQIYSSRGIQPAGKTLKGMARKTFQYFGKYLVDFFRFSRLSSDEVKKMVSFEHLEYLNDTLNLGRGVILITPHFGNWELGGAVLASMGYCIHAVVYQQRLQKLDRLLEDQRERRGLKLIPAGHAVRGILNCLKKGEVVGMLSDRDFTPRDDLALFFGKPARIPRGPAWLSMKTGAPVLPCVIIRQDDDTFLFRFHSPILPEREGSAEKIREKICTFMEKEISERPNQWFVFEDFWRNEQRHEQ